MTADGRVGTTMRYWAWTRAIDMWNGWRDGLHGLPGDTSTGTPTSEALVSRCEHRIATEEALAAPVFSTHRAAVTSLTEQYDHAAQRAATARIVLAELPAITEAELVTRRIAEAELPESLIRQRRRREHEKRRATLQAQADELDAMAQQLLADLRRAEAALAGLVAAQDARVHRLRAHSRRRLDTYWNQLVRRHPDGVRLNRRLAPETPELPEWVAA
ncbi:hypothetical protein [Cryptosporangium sp. NPDC048952]|uniref:hypothetical protein n=1 Tax=Cryptosporangium sp. NPDC048952 TaxID=3363961 RepID=UPI00371B58BB